MYCKVKMPWLLLLLSKRSETSNASTGLSTTPLKATVDSLARPVARPMLNAKEPLNVSLSLTDRLETSEAQPRPSPYRWKRSCFFSRLAGATVHGLQAVYAADR